MDNFIIILIMLAVTGLAARYIYKAKKNGKKCIGCPASGNCCPAQRKKCNSDEEK